MFIDEKEFELIRGTFEKSNPELAKNKKAIRKKIKELEDEAKKLLAEWGKNPNQENQFRIALDILGQGRNFLALFVGLKQVDFLAGLPKKEAEKSPLETRHVAILVSAEIMALALESALGVTAPESLRFKIYQHSQGLNDDILDGKICGIIGINHQESARVDSYIRHELKNRSGWNYQKSEECVLPPCANLSALIPNLAVSIIETVEKMQRGEFREKESGIFNLDDCLPELQARMFFTNSCRVCVIDDKAKEIAGIVKILKAWPGITPETVIYNGSKYLSADPSVNIYLVDEDFGSGETGSDFAESMMSSGALLASISGGGTPKWCTPQRHFSLKSSIEKNRESAIAFVEFMNKLLEKAGY